MIQYMGYEKKEYISDATVFDYRSGIVLKAV